MYPIQDTDIEKTVIEYDLEIAGCILYRILTSRRLSSIIRGDCWMYPIQDTDIEKTVINYKRRLLDVSY
jgi:hypothetical protein